MVRPALPSPVSEPPSPRRKTLGQVLLERRLVSAADLMNAATLARHQQSRVADVLLSRGWIGETTLLAAMSEQWGAEIVDLAQHPADVRLLDLAGLQTCVANRVLPWRRLGGATVVVTARPEDFATVMHALPATLGPTVMALAPEGAIVEALQRLRQTALIRRAETQVGLSNSCRTFRPDLRATLGLVLAVAILAIAVPGALFWTLFGWAVITLVATSMMKLAALIAVLTRHPAPPGLPTSGLGEDLPHVSVMVPLLREDDIASRLVARIKRLRYPRELLDVVLVVEDDDRLTRDTLANTPLPHWIRVVKVPKGPIRTKPRALNYALNFCRGTIIGVYDAEDAPDPDQILTVARRFRVASPDVACLQGILDFYGARRNWLTRAFAIEYAGWFRVVLPGLARLGLVVPLGGTTLFFRREILERLGGWDAHNVTEDADLGLRLARRGYRTELIASVTEEEPNARIPAWIRQRSRWIKGYAMTWAVHMRNPLQLLRDLGPWRFLGVQVLFLGSLSQSLLAPILWSFWGLALGLGHPVASALPTGLLAALSLLFVGSEIINLAIGFRATRARSLRHLRIWLPSLFAYYPLATLAAFKAAQEIITRPFYWDKTEHGHVDEVPQGLQPAAVSIAVARPADPAGAIGETAYAPFFLTKSVARKISRAGSVPAVIDNVVAFPQRNGTPPGDRPMARLPNG